MGRVYLARHDTVVGIRCLSAVKVAVGDPAVAGAALIREARRTAAVAHPNVARLVDAGIDDGVPWLATEYVPGVSLAELFAECPDGLPPWMIARVVADVCEGLAAIHDATDESGARLSMVHLDVSPSNVVLGWNGVVKLVDFGAARTLRERSVRTPGLLLGNLEHMSPEQARGDDVDARADVFGAGILLWEGLTGERLFSAGTDNDRLAKTLSCRVPSVSAWSHDVPPALSQVAARALAEERSGRFPTAKAMRRTLLAAMRGADVDVGASEITAVLATVFPDRINEHERWLATIPLSEAPPRLEDPPDPTPPPHVTRGSGTRPAVRGAWSKRRAGLGISRADGRTRKKTRQKKIEPPRCQERQGLKKWRCAH
jgi:serine/threonine-protein kinase